MEGLVLSERAKRRGHARLLREQVSDGRDQQHVLSAAARARRRRVGCTSPGWFHLRHQGQSADNTLQTTGTRIRRAGSVSNEGTGATGAETGANPVSAAAEYEEGCGQALAIPRDAACRQALCVRVPTRELVR